jgi:hypothetical protein
MRDYGGSGYQRCRGAGLGAAVDPGAAAVQGSCSSRADVGQGKLRLVLGYLTVRSPVENPWNHPENFTTIIGELQYFSSQGASAWDE